MTPGLTAEPTAQSRRKFFSGNDFPWPTPPAAAGIPRWNGGAFDLGNGSVRVLAYDAADSNWSERLSDINEIEAGRAHPIGRESRRLAIASMRRLAKRRPVRILDVGCSTGFVLDDLAQAIPEADLIGADYLRGPIERLAERLPGLPLLQFDLRQCPLPDACVDGITCLNVLEHIDDDRAALRHLYRILKPGGFAHVEVPANPALHDIYDEHLMHYRRYRLAELIALASAAGFAVARATHLGFCAYPAFWCVKKWNRRKLSAPPDEKARLVIQQIRRTKTSPLFSVVMRVESALGRLVSYPYGIRCVVVLRKP
jgi:SAM-dependent methyltransferase